MSAPRKPRPGAPAATKLRKEQRLHQIEQLYLADPDADPTGRVLDLLTHEGLPGDRRLPPRTAAWYLAQVRERLLRRAAVDREEALALCIRRLDDLYRGAVSKGRHKDAAFIAVRRADLDGSRVAAEEAAQPTPLDQLLGLRARTLDWAPTRPPVELPTLTPAEQRFWVQRGLHLARRAGDAAAAFRGLGAPPATETARRLWLQQQQALAVHLRATLPGSPPDRRCEAIHRGATAYAMLTRDADVAQQIDNLERDDGDPVDRDPA